MKDDQLELLISANLIADKVLELATMINKDYEGRDLLVIGVLKGAVIFMSDLVRKIDIPLQMSFIAVSSYNSNTVSTHDIRLRFDVDISCLNKDILIVEDIADTGHTLNFLHKHFDNKGASTVKICTLLDKPSRREVDVKVDYIGFEIPNKFVVGYGLDYDNMYRNLDSVYALKI